MLDKVEPPSIPEGYAMSVAFSGLLDLVRGITAMMERELAHEEEEAGRHRKLNPDKQWKPEPGDDDTHTLRIHILHFLFRFTIHTFIQSD